MNRLVFADIKKNLRLFIGTIISVAVAVAIISACMTLVLSSAQLKDFGHRFDGVDVAVMADKTVTISYMDGDDLETDSKDISGRVVLNDEQVNFFLKEYDGIADYTFFAKPQNLEYSRMAGHNAGSMELTDFEIISGDLPNAGEVLIDSDFADKNALNIGDEMEIKLNDRFAVFNISGIVNSDIEDVYGLQNYLFFQDEEAKNLSNGCYTIGIKTNDSKELADELKKEGYEVYYGDKINRAEIKDIVIDDIALMIVFITMGSLCLMISLFVISGTIQFSIRNRFRTLALLRVLGFKKYQVKSILRRQSFVISLIGGALGVLLSIPICNIIVDAYRSFGIISGEFEIIHYYLMDAAVVAAVAMLVLLVTGMTANKPLSVAPATAIKSEGDLNSKVTVGGVITGIVLMLGGVAILIFTPMTQGIGIGMGFVSSSLFLGGAMLLTPILMQVINFLLSIFTRRLYNGMGGVASANIKMKASKFAVASVSIAIMMSMGTVMMLNNITYMDSMVKNKYEFAKEYDYLAYNVSPFEVEDAEAMGYKSTEMLIRKGTKVDDLEAIAVLGNLPNISIVEGKAELNENEIILSDKVGKYEIGDKVEMWLENGEPITMTVSAFISSDGIKDENISGIVRYEDVHTGFFSGELSKVYLYNPIEGAVENTVEMYKESPSYDIQLGASLLLGGIGILLSVVALFNTFAVIMSVRKKEFNGLKLIGAKKNQIFKMTLIETIIVTVTGLIIGMAVLYASVGTYSMENIGVYDWIVDKQLFWGTITVSAVLGLLAGIIPSVGTIIKLRKQFRNE